MFMRTMTKNFAKGAAPAQIVYSLAFILLLTLGVGITVTKLKGRKSLSPKAAVSTVSLLFNAENSGSWLKDKDYTAELFMDAGPTKVSATELHLKFPSHLELVKVSAGSFLPVLLESPQIASGTATVILGSSPQEPKSGSGILATLTFRTHSSGYGQLLFDPSSQVAAVGENHNVVGTMIPFDIIIVDQTATSFTTTASATPTSSGTRSY